MRWKKHEVATKIQKRHKTMYNKKGTLNISGGTQDLIPVI